MNLEIPPQIQPEMPAVFKINTDDTVSKNLSKLKQTQEKPEILPLVPEDHPLLKQVLPEFDFANAPVNPNQFASALVETCKHYRGYGLSANQCGFNHRVFVMGAEDQYVAFFNPKLINTEDETHMIEGCLSFPMLGLRITRPKTIDVEYQDFNGIVRTQRFSGISAQIGRAHV